MQNAEILAKQLSLMRQEAEQTARDSRHCATDAINKTKVTATFEIGQKVYKVDVLDDSKDHKTAPKFEEPYVLVDCVPHNLYKLIIIIIIITETSKVPLTGAQQRRTVHDYTKTK